MEGFYKSCEDPVLAAPGGPAMGHDHVFMSLSKNAGRAG